MPRYCWARQGILQITCSLSLASAGSYTGNLLKGLSSETEAPNTHGKKWVREPDLAAMFGCNWNVCLILLLLEVEDEGSQWSCQRKQIWAEDAQGVKRHPQCKFKSTSFSNVNLGFLISLLQAIRAPIVWNRPTAGLFDYHYDVAGLYYQVNSTNLDSRCLMWCCLLIIIWSRFWSQLFAF